jgi:uncharacterized protein
MSQTISECEPHRFAADQMLGRLARMLRLLGCDTAYSQESAPAALADLAGREGRMILTRGDIVKRFPGAARVFVVTSNVPAEQLGEVVRAFALDTQSGLLTRCTLCNGLIERVEKSEVEAAIPPKALAAYTEFYRCSACAHVYWRGSHVERILKNLAAILRQGREVDA